MAGIESSRQPISGGEVQWDVYFTLEGAQYVAGELEAQRAAPLALSKAERGAAHPGPSGNIPGVRAELWAEWQEPERDRISGRVH